MTDDASALSPNPTRSLQQLPYTALEWRTFELFVAELLGRSRDFDRVQNYGEAPDEQRGVDIVARRDEKTWAFQCKRVAKFSVSQFRVVQDQASGFSADQFVLVISCRARTTLIDAIKDTGWILWDADELDRRVRDLDDAYSFVEGYFGTNIAARFLGQRSAGHFLTPRAFFEPYLRPERAEDIGVALIDRDNEIDVFRRFLADDEKRVLLIKGPSGIGKTKLLYELAKRVEGSEETWRLTREASDISDDVLDGLSVRVSLVVIDNVQQVRHVDSLFSALVRSKRKLVLTVRSGSDFDVSYQLQRNGYDSSQIETLALPALTRTQSDIFAESLIDRPSESARLTMYKLSSGTPLVIQIIAYLLNEGEGDLLESLANKEYPIDVLFVRYAEVLAGKVSSQRSNREDVLKVLQLLAALGPRDIRNADFQKASLEVLDMDSARFAQAIIALEQGAIIVRSGSKTRIVPDLLAIFILREACGIGTVQTDYAQRLVKTFGFDRQLLINLAIVDRMDETAKKSLGPVWEALKDEVEQATPYERLAVLSELDDLGYLLPSLMLGIVTFVVNNPVEPDPNQPLRELHAFDQDDVLRKLPRILQAIAFSGLEFLPQTVDMLWRLGRDEERRFGYEDAFGVLLGLARYERHKPLDFNMGVLAVIETINADPNEQEHKHLPIEVAARALARTYESTEERHGTLTIGRFAVPARTTERVRSKALDIMQVALNGGSSRAAVKSVHYLAECLARAEVALDEQSTAIWRYEKSRVFDMLQAARTDPSKGLLHAVIGAALSWHSQLNPDEFVRERSFAIVDGLEGTPSFDWYASLIPDVARDMPSVRVGEDFNHLQKAIDSLLDRVVNRVFEASTSPNELVDKLAVTLTQVSEAGLNGAASWLLIALSNKDLEYAKRVAEVIISYYASQLGDAISPVIFAAWSADPEWTDRALSQILQSGEQRLLMSFAHALWMNRAPGVEASSSDTDHRAAVLRQLIALGNPSVREVALRAVGTLMSIDKTAALELIFDLDLGEDSKTADEVFANLRSIEPSELGSRGLERMLNYIVSISEIDYWAFEFLRKISKDDPQSIVDVLIRRIEHAAGLPWSKRDYKPVPYGHAIMPHEVSFFTSLQLTPNAIEGILDRGFALNERGRYWATELLSNLSLSPEPVFSALSNWAHNAPPDKLVFVAQAMQRIPADILFKNIPFVASLLNRAAELGTDCERKVRSALFSSAVSGLRTGIPYEPMPQDVSMVEAARAARETLAKGSPAERFFETVENHGIDSIAKKLEEDIDHFGERE